MVAVMRSASDYDKAFGPPAHHPGQENLSVAPVVPVTHSLLPRTEAMHCHAVVVRSGSVVVQDGDSARVER